MCKYHKMWQEKCLHRAVVSDQSRNGCWVLEWKLLAAHVRCATAFGTYKMPFVRCQTMSWGVSKAFSFGTETLSNPVLPTCDEGPWTLPERGVKGTKVFAGKPQCVCAPRTPCPSVRDPPFSPRKAKPICFSLVYTLLLILRLVLVGSLCFQFKRALRIPSGAGGGWSRVFSTPLPALHRPLCLVTPGFIPTLSHLPSGKYFLKGKK